MVKEKGDGNGPNDNGHHNSNLGQAGVQVAREITVLQELVGTLCAEYNELLCFSTGAQPVVVAMEVCVEGGQLSLHD